jgi:hypothetical protein
MGKKGKVKPARPGYGDRLCSVCGERPQRSYHPTCEDCHIGDSRLWDMSRSRTRRRLSESRA